MVVYLRTQRMEFTNLIIGVRLSVTDKKLGVENELKTLSYQCSSGNKIMNFVVNLEFNTYFKIFVEPSHASTILRSP